MHGLPKNLAVSKMQSFVAKSKKSRIIKVDMDNRESSKSFFKIFVIYAVVLVAFVGVRIASSLGAFDAIKNPFASDAVSTVIIQICIMVLIPAIMYLCMFKKKPKQMLDDFGFKKINAKSVLICFAIGILAFIVNLFVSNFFSILLSEIGFNPQYSSSGGISYDTFPNFLYGVLTIAILPAICEEFVHRGLILRGAGKTVGYKKAIVISSILFGLMHLNIQQFFYTAIMGFLMALVNVMTMSIYPSIIVHFCNNFINVLIIYLGNVKPFGFSLSSAINTLASQNIILFFIISLAVISLSVYGIFALLKRLFLQNGAKNYDKMFGAIETQIRQTGGNNMTDADVEKTFQKYVLPNMKTPKNLMDMYIGDNAHYGDLNLKYKIPLISCFVLAGIVTVFTFVWGVI